MNQTLATLATTMLHDSKLPKSFWVDVMQTAAYITACSPALGLHGKTPYEILFKRRVDPTLFRLFRCQVYALIPKDKRQGKFYSKGHKAIMIGYTHGKQAYKLLDTEKQTVFSSWHVIFNESGKTKKHWKRMILTLGSEIQMNDPDPRIRDPNEWQMEPHFQGDVPQAIEPYQHEDNPRAVGAPDQLRHPPQQSLQPK
ncbi:hypothetical protein SERLADRAFT_442137 [Serpula lacrymans var. lacrymans S7.9]|uniref:Retroviral polymerase SH3-like domain-containing protein n=1 Tax=Serpula lacrymans var. lacrymans (strain S7.9) TaxID=578457 RepID=F8P8N4_SERL9|nr:uncharacterized protein SERLADRAFT_442137 [Serpula lacrymans var. lacrymans S7.9]EGO20790.1 hypothetical protein SERLADRAFT_442137 [Serpula lacrymans var. lacrymans S7.9]